MSLFDYDTEVIETPSCSGNLLVRAITNDYLCYLLFGSYPTFFVLFSKAIFNLVFLKDIRVLGTA